jgi:TPR repeat protein
MDLDRLERQAAAGSAVAQAVLGVCHLDGVGVPVDLERAFDLLTRASVQGVSRAMVNLGRMYERGLATPQDAERAAVLYKSAARSGEFLGWIYLARLQRASGSVAGARESYQQALVLAERVVDCDEVTEARDFVAGSTD